MPKTTVNNQLMVKTCNFFQINQTKKNKLEVPKFNFDIIKTDRFNFPKIQFENFQQNIEQRIEE